MDIIDPSAALTACADEELYDALRRIQDEIDRRDKERFLTAVFNWLGSAPDMAEAVADHGDVVKVTFDTEEFENGYFFSSLPTVRFVDHHEESDWEGALDVEGFEVALTQMSCMYFPLGRHAELSVDLSSSDPKLEFNG